MEMQQNLVSTCDSIHTPKDLSKWTSTSDLQKVPNPTDSTSSICFGLNKDITLRSSLIFSGEPKEQLVRVTFGALGAPKGSARNALLFPTGRQQALFMTLREGGGGLLFFCASNLIFE
jgi:hypothetical protein